MRSARRWRARIAAPAIAIALALILALAKFVNAPYAQSMDGNGNHSRPRLEPSSWPDSALTIASLGHAAVLMNFFGTRLISDPSLYDRVGLSIGPIVTIGPKRHVDPPLAPAQIGPLDLILITHAHMDHLDLPSLKSLPRSAVVIACEKCAPLIAPLGFADIRELKWGEQTTVNGLTISAMGARHWGKRWPWGQTFGYNTYVLDKNGHRVMLGCDSAVTNLFADIASNPPEVAIFSIGAYNPWIWNHANPEQVWSMFQQTHARYLVPIHWGTFRLSNEPMEEPLRRLIAASGAEQNRIVLREIGGAWTLPESAEAHDRAAAANAR
ncbi:MAG: MBL fold metallo-hydrolase [Candidatus Binatus sp.]|uniref:MBL fold metallo-hydrolase n=1 Tax=Candidatus Binatus sp. TaxID=2811406 RepID=UPI002726CE6F|nr:MBL fold metallo-hydrolase [Candidatus Binatus sp.]MDO8433083.1 MBL fold metallo-hydrolase [Candidatus Binatus sp.]